VELRELTAVLEVTAYIAGYESTGKRPGDPGYGITYSGTRAQQWRTVAAGPDIPIGTRVFIPALGHMPNGGIFVVEDRGGAISNAHLDIYMDNLRDARNWGRRHLEAVFFLPADLIPVIAAKIQRDRYKWKDKKALKELFS